jgi:stearoyl-CoA desaturase (delta-9 desaturase)
LARAWLHRGETPLAVILTFFVAHWVLSVFFQTFFQHRYGAHRMFTMSKGWERFFYLATVFFQGSSFLNPRAYAILHREHHAFSDGERDPHSPHVYTNLGTMMWHTKERYYGLLSGKIQPEARFEGGYPSWPIVDKLADSWFLRIAFGTAYTLVYIAFVPHGMWYLYLLLPFHYLMGPVHGAIVNWCGHKYGYRNFAGDEDDKSRNTLVFDFVTLGELFQNNHHKYGQSPNFAVRWFEIDPTWWVIRVWAWMGILKLPARMQKTRWTPEARIPATATAAAAARASVAPPSLGSSAPAA